MHRIQPKAKNELAPGGELQWDYEAMEMWQILQLFRKQYQGDFSEQWMLLVMAQKGMDYVGEGRYL